jgi:hypothetical protein
LEVCEQFDKNFDFMKAGNFPHRQPTKTPVHEPYPEVFESIPYTHIPFLENPL